jgi:hypothetical protein
MKTTTSKTIFISLLLLLIFVLHFPFSFGKSNTFNKSNYATLNLPLERSVSLYTQLNLDSLGLCEEAYQLAMKGYANLLSSGRIINQQIISIIDFTKPSTEKRLYIIDIASGKLLFNTYVAHGQNSGGVFAQKFSNVNSSYQSSLGFYETMQTYNGKNGYSLQLNGLEKGINDNANQRAIVVHGAPYVSELFIKMRGLLGRSWGCPAIPENVTKPIIDKIKNGTCLFIYANDKKYFKNSSVLNA